MKLIHSLDNKEMIHVGGAAVLIFLGGPSRLFCLFHKIVNGVKTKRRKKKKNQLKWPVAPTVLWDKRWCCKQKGSDGLRVKLSSFPRSLDRSDSSPTKITPGVRSP